MKIKKGKNLVAMVPNAQIAMVMICSKIVTADHLLSL